MSLKFTKAKRSQAKLRLALAGVSGGGKTYTALTIAKGIGGRIALIDTENASASKYADVVDFDTLQLSEFSPRNYVEAIKAAEGEGYGTIIIDSLSHGWSGKGGALDMASAAADRSKSKNTFAAWKDVTPEYNRVIDALIQSKAHVIATMRAKEEYAQEKDDNGRLQVRKLGLGAIAGKGIEYEFDIVLDMSDSGKVVVQKSRYAPLNGKVLLRPGVELGQELSKWLSDGPEAEAVPGVVSVEKAIQEATTEFQRLFAALTVATADQVQALGREVFKAKSEGALTEDEVNRLREIFNRKQGGK